MTTVLPEFTDEAINSDIELSYIKKFNTQLQPLLLLSPPFINNSYGVGIKLNLSTDNNVNCYGDNIMLSAASHFNYYFNTLYNKIGTFYNFGSSGAVDGTMDAIIINKYNDILATTVAANLPTILICGVNDIVKTNDLYIFPNGYSYGQACMGCLLPFLLPIDKIVYCRNMTTKTGVWTVSTTDNVGFNTLALNNYLEHTLVGVRYIAVSWLDFQDLATNATLFTVYVDGVIAAIVDKNIVKFGTYLPLGVSCAIVIDTYTTGNRVVKIVHGKSTLGVYQYIAGWTAADISNSTNKKKLLVCYNNKTPASETVTDYNRKRLDLTEMMRCAVNSLYRVKLPIGLLLLPDATSATISGTNTSTFQYKSWAEFIMKNGVKI